MGHCLCFGSRIKDKRDKRNNKAEDGINVRNRKQPNSAHKVTERCPGQGLESSPMAGTDSSHKGRTFKFRELATATNDFKEDSFIGQGGFGAVYKGKLEKTGQVVAVKRLDTTIGLQGDKEFLVEVLMLSLLRHPNLVHLIGYCAEGDQRLLVYEFMPLGSLESLLHDLAPGEKPLDWNTRMMIAAGAAKGLHYLHHEANPPVIYRDLKTSNILLDEGFCPKLSDFGLAKFGPSGDHSHVSTRVMGTQGYCAPEYATTGKLTMKSDIYSFGVVLLELITGRKALDGTYGRDKLLVAWARPILRDKKQFSRLADPRLQDQYPRSGLTMAVEVASLCLQEDPSLRPLTGDIVQALDYLSSRLYTPRESNVASSEGREEDDSLKETSRMTMTKDLNRAQAVAEAKQWGERWREKRRQNAQGSPDEVNR